MKWMQLRVAALALGACQGDTTSFDTTAPMISDTASFSITASAASIRWTTNEVSDTRIDYGTTTSYEISTTLDSSMTTIHSQTLSQLSPGTTYHYRVKSSDAAGNLAAGDDLSFTTASGSSGRMHGLVSWISISDMDTMLGGSTPSAADVIDAGLVGQAVSMGIGDDSDLPSWLVSEFGSMAELGKLFAGYYIAAQGNPLPTSSAELAVSMVRWNKLATALASIGASGLVLDGEPYGYPGGGDHPADNPWVVLISSTIAYDYGLAIGKLAASHGFEIIVYSSSNGSWVGSNNDEIRTQNGVVNSYVDNKFADFIDGLIAGAGAGKVTLSDASFDSGAQNTRAHGDWSAAIEICAELTAQRFPDALASDMFWPDNTEHSGGQVFDPSYMGYVAGVSVQRATGYAVMYEQHLTDSDYSEYWQQVLAMIDANL